MGEKTVFDFKIGYFVFMKIIIHLNLPVTANGSCFPRLGHMGSAITALSLIVPVHNTGIATPNSCCDKEMK